MGLAVWTSSCHCSDDSKPPPQPVVIEPAPTESELPPPQQLYLPDAAPVALSGSPPSLPSLGAVCPPDMVSVRGRFCIDRFEASVVDAQAGRNVSPYYHPTFFQTRSTYRVWQEERKRSAEPEFRLLPIPEPPAFQLEGTFDVKAVVRRGVTPNGYVSGTLAERACTNAGKRLCTEEEWVTACRGERDQQFPYGDEYEPGKCNVFGGKHPAKILHGNASIGHLDPRLNQFAHEGSPLLHATGDNPACVSRWGDDGVWDMVGNLDEWIDDEEGVFLGGFYARNTKQGCLARIGSHPRNYFDYSLGIRCCR